MQRPVAGCVHGQVLRDVESIPLQAASSSDSDSDSSDNDEAAMYVRHSSATVQFASYLSRSKHDLWKFSDPISKVPRCTRSPASPSGRYVVGQLAAGDSHVLVFGPRADGHLPPKPYKPYKP